MDDRPIDPGDLNVRILWARREPNPGGHPGSADEFRFVPVGTYSAKVETLRPFEVYAAAQNKQAVDTRITLRDVGDIRTGDRLTTQGGRPVAYTVKVPTRPNEHRGFIVLTAAAAVAP